MCVTYDVYALSVRHKRVRERLLNADAKGCAGVLTKFKTDTRENTCDFTFINTRLWMLLGFLFLLFVATVVVVVCCYRYFFCPLFSVQAVFRHVALLGKY